MLQFKFVPLAFSVLLFCWVESVRDVKALSSRSEGSREYSEVVSSVGQCGGALEGDKGVIVYPGNGDTVQQDELCIWTVHLLTTTTIRLNISQVDFEGGEDGSCSQGSLRTYSLTNLVRADNIESYTICGENVPSGGLLFLSDNAMVVTFRTSNLTSQGGEGFTFSWEGIKFSPISISHSSSASSSPDGIIRYPILGEYSPNVLNTWLVTLNPQSSSNESPIDLTLINSEIETCSDAPDVDCFCDAAIIYTVAQDGTLNEHKRFCGELGSPYQAQIEERNFLVAFYADSVNLSGKGNGFELIWTHEPEATTTVGSTTPPPQVISTICSEVIELEEEDRGRISYSTSQLLEGNDEICTWTIRANGSPNIRVKVEDFESDTEDGSELDIHYLIPNRWNNVGSIINKHSLLSEPSLAVEVAGPVAFVTLSSKGNRTVGSTTSFQLLIERDPTSADATYPVNSVYTDLILRSDDGDLRYPQVPTYQSNELSTFLINPTRSNGSSYVKLNFDWIDIDDCYDMINIFILEDNQFVLKRELCSSDYLTEYFANDVFLMIFTTDSSRLADGFEARWQTKFPSPSSTCGGVIDLVRGDLGEIDYIEPESDEDFSNENCVWTIRAQRSRTITLTLGDYLFNECNADNLIAVGFTGNFSDHDGALTTEKTIIGDCEVERVPKVMTGPVTFLVLKRVPGRFQVTIDHESNLSEIEYPYWSNYTDFYLTQESGSLIYPGRENWPQFDPYLWTTFVISPLERNTTSRLSLKFTILDMGQDGFCDNNNFMTYELRDGLQFQFMICRDAQIPTVEIFGDSTIIMVLRTKGVWTSYGNTVAFEWAPRNAIL